MYEKDIGKKIRELRIKQGLSQDELAAKLDKSGNSGISKIENGTQIINADELKRIAVILHSTPNEILGFKTISENSIVSTTSTKKQIKIRDFRFSITKFEWIWSFVLIILPLVTIFTETDTSYIIVFVIFLVVFIAIIKSIIEYLFKKVKNTINIQTDVNNTIVCVHKWEQAKLMEHRRSSIFFSFFGMLLSFLYIVVFSNLINEFFPGNASSAVLITLLMFIPPIARIFNSINLNSEIDVDYKDIKDNSLLFLLCLLINVTSLLFVAIYISYQKSINLDAISNDLLFLAVAETLLTLFSLFAHVKYLENYDVYVLEKYSKEMTKIDLHTNKE